MCRRQLCQNAPRNMEYREIVDVQNLPPRVEDAALRIEHVGARDAAQRRKA